METKANYVMIGAATIIGAALIMLFAMWLTNANFRGGAREYDVEFDEPVRGLAEGGEVRFNGIKVGEVRDLRIENTTRVVARIRVEAGVPVNADSEAQLEPIGLTGVTLIQLSPGSATAGPPRSPAFGQLPRIKGRGSQIDILVEQSEDIVMDASRALASIRNLLTDENIARVNRVLANLETISTQLADRRSIVTRSGEAAGAITVAANDIAGLARQAQSDLAALDEVVTEVRAAAAVASGETLPEIALAAQELRRASEAVTRVANNLEESPSVLTPRSPRPVVELPP